MINLKTAVFSRPLESTVNRPTRRITEQKHQQAINKCPVNTLLTRIFSGIAWNG